MTRVEPAATRVRTRRPRRWLLGIGVALLLVPVLALVVPDREPDPLFQHDWWSPIGSVPTSTLLVGSIGLDLLVATGLAMLLRRRGTRAVVLGALALTLALAGAWTALAAVRAHASADVAHDVLVGGRSEVASREAVRAVRLDLAWPGADPNGIHIRELGSVPAGPMIVQTIEVLNENMSDEAADVTVESLVDPVTGRVIASWFSRL